MSSYVEFEISCSSLDAEKLFDATKEQLDITGPEDVLGEHGMGHQGFYGVLLPAAEKLNLLGSEIKVFVVEYVPQKKRVA